MRTIMLSDSWDLEIDSFANIAVAEDGLALAQDAASAIKTFQGEVYYDSTQGVPYWQQVLGFSPPVSLMKSFFNQAALTVPEVVSSVTFISSIQNRIVAGQVQVQDAAGQISAAAFTQVQATVQIEME